MQSSILTGQRHPPNEHPKGDAWVDQVADEVTAVLNEHGLELELCVFYDPLTATLHGTGYDGSPARYFRSLEADHAAKGALVSSEVSPGAACTSPKCARGLPTA
jgi:hypothetical protein